MLTGRAIFGVGAESLYITQTAILATWFDESSMSFALSVLLVATRMSSVANSLVAPAVGSAVTAFDIGCAVCGVAWVAAVFIALHHAAYERCVGLLTTVVSFLGSVILDVFQAAV